MRKIVAGFASSVDGYIEGSNGEYDWILIDKEIDFAEEAKRFDTYFLDENLMKQSWLWAASQHGALQTMFFLIHW